jgi:uncharacterized phage protein (TIGR01671 family)
MREIKFRGKTQDGKWVYGDLIHSGTDTIAILEFDAPCLESVTDVVPDTIGQFTGLHDKNGREIYEGDVLFVREWENLAMRVFDHEERDLFSLEDCKGGFLHESQRVVYFEGGSMYAGDYYISTLWDEQDQRHQYPIFEVELLGNIHDNPNFDHNGND